MSRLGLGPTYHLTLGGKTDALHGPPVNVTGLRAAHRRRAVRGTRADSRRLSLLQQRHLGRADTDDGHTLLLVSTRYLNTSRQQYYAVGVRPEDYRIIVGKGVVSPRPAYQPIAAEMLLVNTAGASSADLSTFTSHRRRPLYPFEPDATYP